ncbi:MAG: hypothetical protein ABIS03_00730 [Gemmatimonadaceae bacterium]
MRRATQLAVVGALLLLATVPQRTASGQGTEYRIDGVGGREPSLEAGIGYTVPLGTYVTSGLVVAAGRSREGRTGRFDAITRFRLDPFRQQRWSPYGGGGVSFRVGEHRTPEPYLLLVAGAEGPLSRGFLMTVEAGLGGGARIGLSVRRKPAKRR